MFRFGLFALMLIGLTVNGLINKCSGPGASDGPVARASTPSEPRRSSELLRNSDGHFYTYAKVNGQLVHFLVDTGSTGVALTEEDAERVGIRIAARARQIGEGASGAVYGQLATLDSVEVDGKLVNDVSGAVLQGSSISLLGQSYLTRMGEVQMSGDYMILK